MLGVDFYPPPLDFQGKLLGQPEDSPGGQEAERAHVVVVENRLHGVEGYKRRGAVARGADA